MTSPSSNITCIKANAQLYQGSPKFLLKRDFRNLPPRSPSGGGTYRPDFPGLGDRFRIPVIRELEQFFGLSTSTSAQELPIISAHGRK